jgi:hypothetical protein
MNYYGVTIVDSHGYSVVDDLTRASIQACKSRRRYRMQRLEIRTYVGPVPVTRHFCKARTVTPRKSAACRSDTSPSQ